MQIHIPTILISFLAFSSFTFADEPTELTDLNSNYDKAVERATTPIKKKYIRALKALKLRYTKQGKLSEAIAVDNKLKSLTAKQERDSKPLPTITIQSNTAFEIKKIEVGISRLSRFDAKFSWYNKDVEDWFFTKVPWQTTPNHTVTFNEAGTIYIVRVDKFSSDDGLTKKRVKSIAKGSWLDDQVWYEVRGKKGDSFTCSGGECMLLAETITNKKMFNKTRMTKPLSLWSQNREYNFNHQPEVESAPSAAAGIALTFC